MTNSNPTIKAIEEKFDKEFKILEWMAAPYHHGRDVKKQIKHFYRTQITKLLEGVKQDLLKYKCGEHKKLVAKINKLIK